MEERRFNFFDVYGYVIPGSFFIIATLLPILAVAQVLPAELNFGESTLVLVVALFAAYITGVIIQFVAGFCLKRSWHCGKPTQVYYHASTGDDARIALLVSLRLSRMFGNTPEYWQNVDDPGLLCRSAAIAAGKAAYIEQFEGLHYMMRGLCVSCMILVCASFGFIAPSITDLCATVACGCGWNGPSVSAIGLTAVASISSAFLFKRYLRLAMNPSKAEPASWREARSWLKGWWKLSRVELPAFVMFGLFCLFLGWTARRWADPMKFPELALLPIVVFPLIIELRIQTTLHAQNFAREIYRSFIVLPDSHRTGGG